MRGILDRDSKRPLGINVERLLHLSRFPRQRRRIDKERGSAIRIGTGGLRDDAVRTGSDESVGPGGSDAFGLGVVLGLSDKFRAVLRKEALKLHGGLLPSTPRAIHRHPRQQQKQTPRTCQTQSVRAKRRQAREKRTVAFVHDQLQATSSSQHESYATERAFPRDHLASGVGG